MKKKMDCNKEIGIYIVPIAGAIRIYIGKELYEVKMNKDDMTFLATEILTKRLEMNDDK
tara:strand:+ start:288 stop:464 length:177 start_codon:yes stop_codon:yes gene_type:complete